MARVFFALSKSLLCSAIYAISLNSYFRGGVSKTTFYFLLGTDYTDLCHFSSLKHELAKYYDKRSSENRVKFTNCILVSNTRNFKVLYLVVNQVVKIVNFFFSIKRHKKTAYFARF